MASDPRSLKETALEVENAGLRELLTQAGIDAALEIGPNAVLPITLSLNELCTNAVKYGALSNGAGRIDIKSVVDEKNLTLTWAERGGPPVREPTRRSFGTRLIHRLAEQLHG